MQVSSTAANGKMELAKKQAELDRAVHQFRDGVLTAEAARQIIAQVQSLHPMVVTCKACSSALCGAQA